MCSAAEMHRQDYYHLDGHKRTTHQDQSSMDKNHSSIRTAGRSVLNRWVPVIRRQSLMSRYRSVVSLEAKRVPVDGGGSTVALWSSRRVEALVGTPCVAFTRPRLVRMSRCPVGKCFLIDGSSETCRPERNSTAERGERVSNSADGTKWRPGLCSSGQILEAGSGIHDPEGGSGASLLGLGIIMLFLMFSAEIGDLGVAVSEWMWKSSCDPGTWARVTHVRNGY